MNFLFNQTNYTLSILLLFLFITPVFSENNLYTGINAYYSLWTIGLANNRTIKATADTSTVLKKKQVNLIMLSADITFLVDRKWAYTYSSAYGFSTVKEGFNSPTTQTQTASCSLLPCTIVNEITDTKIQDVDLWRNDHNLAVTRLLGNSGFSIFAGLKLQVFNYTGTLKNGNRNIKQTRTITQGPMTGNTNITFFDRVIQKKTVLSSLAGGPAIGLGYSWHIHDLAHFSLQASYLLMYGKGKITADVKDDQGSDSTFVETDHFIGNGFTALFAIVKPLGFRYLLQLSYRVQLYQTNTVKRISHSTDNTLGVSTTPITETNTALTNKAVDIFHGVSIAFIAQVF